MKHDGTSAGTSIPRQPRRRIFARGSLFRIAMFATLLVGVLSLRKPCSQGIGTFVESFEIDAGPNAPAPDDAGPARQFVHISGDMSEEEINARLRSAGIVVPDAGPDASPAALVGTPAQPANRGDASAGQKPAPVSDTTARE
jgi:hypothetical protein